MSGVNIGLTIQDLTTEVFTRLGYPAISVSLTSDMMLSYINRVLKKYSRLKPMIKYTTISANPYYPQGTGAFDDAPSVGTSNGYYVNLSDLGAYGILAVSPRFTNAASPLLNAANPDINLFAYQAGYNPYDNIISVEYDLQYYQTVSRILSGEFDWEYLDNRIVVTPALTYGSDLMVAYACPRNLGDSNSSTASTVPTADEDLIEDGVTALAKQGQASIMRRLTRNISGATASLSTDADSLMEEGTREWEQWLQNLNDRVPPYPLYMGNSNYNIPLGA